MSKDATKKNKKKFLEVEFITTKLEDVLKPNFIADLTPETSRDELIAGLAERIKELKNNLVPVLKLKYLTI